MREEIVEILRCPATRRPLVLADRELLDAVRCAASEPIGEKAAEDSPDVEHFDGGLVRDDAAVLYPIVAGIPKLLVDQAIVLEGEAHRLALALIERRSRG